MKIPPTAVGGLFKSGLSRRENKQVKDALDELGIPDGDLRTRFHDELRKRGEELDYQGLIDAAREFFGLP